MTRKLKARTKDPGNGRGQLMAQARLTYLKIILYFSLGFGFLVSFRLGL